VINVFFYVLYRIYDVNFGGGESSYGGIRIDRSNEFLLLEQQWIVLREVCDADYQNVLKAIFAAEKGQYLVFQVTSDLRRFVDRFTILDAIERHP